MTFLLRITLRSRFINIEIGKEEAEEHEPQGDVYATTERGYGSEDDDMQIRRRIGFAGDARR